MLKHCTQLIFGRYLVNYSIRHQPYVLVGRVWKPSSAKRGAEVVQAYEDKALKEAKSPSNIDIIVCDG